MLRRQMLGLLGQPCDVRARLHRVSPRAPSETLSGSWRLGGGGAGGMLGVSRISHAWVIKPGSGEGKRAAVPSRRGAASGAGDADPAVRDGFWGGWLDKARVLRWWGRDLWLLEGALP